MINTDSTNYQEAYNNEYFIRYYTIRYMLFSLLSCKIFYYYNIPLHRDPLGKQAVFSWWHGKGGLLDYTNPDAVDWWHHQMDKVNAHFLRVLIMAASVTLIKI